MTDQNTPSLLGAVSRFRSMCVAIVVAAILLSVFVAMLTVGDAQASATIGLRTPSVDNVLVLGQQGDASLGRYTAQRGRFITSDEVLSAVAAELGTDDTASLRSRVSVSASGTANILTVTASGDDADDAIELAHAVVDAYAEQTARQVEERTVAAVDALQSQVDELLAASDGDPSASTSDTVADVQLQIAEHQATQAVFGNGIEFVVAPTTETVVTPGAPIREAVLGLVLGLAIAFTVAWVRADRNRRVTNIDQAGALVERPLLGQLVVVASPRSGVATVDPTALPGDEYRMLWAALEQTAASGAFVLQTVGKMPSRTVTAQLGAAAARDDLAVLLVDADLTSGGLSSMFGCGGSSEGLADTLRSDADWHINAVDIDTLGEYELALLPAGPLGKVDISAQRFASHVDEWRAAFDYVFIDAEPIARSHLAVKAARASDGMVLVVCEGADEREVGDMRRHAAFHGITILGYVFASTESGGKTKRRLEARRRPAASAGATPGRR